MEINNEILQQARNYNLGLYAEFGEKEIKEAIEIKKKVPEGVRPHFVLNAQELTILGFYNIYMSSLSVKDYEPDPHFFDEEE